MANYETLKSAIQQVVKTNDNNEITGALLQQSLLTMINSLGFGYQFAGVATPTTNPGNPDTKVFYLTGAPGTYTNFSSIVVNDGELGILKYDGIWTKLSIPNSTPKNPIFENGEWDNIIVGIQSNFVFDSLELVQLYNRTVETSYASQIVSIEVKIGNSTHILSYRANAGQISSESEVVELFDDWGLPGRKIWVWIRWGGKYISDETHYVINKCAVNFSQEFQMLNFGNHVVSGMVEVAGIYTNFDFTSLTLTRLYNRTIETTYASQIITFSAVINGNTIIFDGYYANGEIHTGIHSYTIQNGQYKIGVLMNWIYPHSDGDISLSVFKECVNIVPMPEENEMTAINNGYRSVVTNDIVKMKGTFSIINGTLIGSRAGTDPVNYVFFNPKIKAIEFDIATLWDVNLVTLAFGYGKDPNNVECAAACFVNTSLRPNEIGDINNVNTTSGFAQFASIQGSGRFSGDYRAPQIPVSPVAIGSHCRIELTKNGFFYGSIKNTTTGEWDFWFCVDTNGSWLIPNRYGWNTAKCIGFAIQFDAFTNRNLLSNIIVTSEDDTYLGIISTLGKNKPLETKSWVAIGDSITEIDKNNGLSYVGFASRENNLRVNNQGKGGWTIYKYWRDRATAGWEDAIAALPDGGIVTILMGTNDFDTKSFEIPINDAAMDAAADPHPRFGTTDATSDTAKDTHTTLGCLRLIIERILELKPTAKLYVFAPFYREKGTIVGSTSWLKDLYINSDGKTIYDYANAIVSVASEYNLPSFNTAKECGINALTLATYTYDDLHLNQYGGELIGHYVAQKIK